MIARYPGTDLMAGPHPTAAAAPSSAIVDVPTLVLNGALETARRRTMGDEISRSLPRAERALIVGAGHLPNLDNPTEYTRCVVPFIDRHSAAQRPPDA